MASSKSIYYVIFMMIGFSLTLSSNSCATKKLFIKAGYGIVLIEFICK